MRFFSILGGAAGAVLLLAGSANAQVTRVLGLDVSAWQSDITTTEWATLKRPTNQQVGGVFGDGRDFVFIRSSRGGTTGYYNQSNAGNDNPPGQNTLSQRYDDPYFIQNITRASNAGLFAGSYHFSRPDIIASTLNANGIANTGADEANHFMQMAGPWMRPGYLLPVHDLEAGDGIRTDNEMAQFTLDFSNRVYEVMGIRPAIYTNGNYANYVIGGATATLRNEVVATHPTLWSARWPNQTNPDAILVQTANPSDSISWTYGPWDDAPNPAQPWSFWQYASTMKLNGNNLKASNTDVNVANGGMEFLKDKLVPALWMNDSSGDWSTLASWNSGQTPVAPVQGPGQVARVGALTLPTPRLPGAAGSGVTSGQHDTVILERANANITVTHSAGTTNIRKLYAREALNITGGELTINYVPSSDSTPISAQFSAAVSLSGGASLSVHTLQVDATRTFTVGGGNLTFNKINLMPAVTPATILLSGDLNVTPLAGATATIANGVGAGTSGRLELGGATREFDVANGAAEVDLSISVPVTNGGLTKAGAGTLALSGANTYAGDTAVEAGSLRLTAANLANTADLYLTTGSLLDLTFAAGAPDVIDSLFFDGASQQAGVWGAVGSGAEFTSSLITGTGTLQVTTFIAPPTPLAGDFDGNGTVEAADLTAWQNGYGMPNGANAGNGDGDADGDVDGNDFLVWQQNLGMTQSTTASAANAAAAPEPTGVVLMLLAMGGMLGRRSER
ncbi:MAG: autotransporter-associated beta strand repeat-containing protein [Pirellulales bacterium]|nr:autotransporter-associated beta strand repeat-containing protein [Pirellulales bacterium]